MLHTNPSAATSSEDVVALLITPGQSAYAAAAPWNRAVVSAPAAVIQARTAGDVAAAVRYAAEHDLRVAVRASGHGAVPLEQSTLLVHTGAMTKFTIDPVRRVVRLGAGVSWQPVVEAAAAFGLAPICGSAPGIGAVGYLTGGGLGPLARSYGLSSDFVRAMDVVVGDGRMLRATPTENEALFWGLRGGKATLGIVTSLEMDLIELESFYGGTLWFDAADTRAVLRAWRRMCADLPEQGTSSAAVLRLPQLDVLPTPIAGRQTLAVRFGWIGQASLGESFLNEIRGAAAPVLDDVQATSLHADRRRAPRSRHPGRDDAAVRAAIRDHRRGGRCPGRGHSTRGQPAEHRGTATTRRRDHPRTSAHFGVLPPGRGILIVHRRVGRSGCGTRANSRRSGGDGAGPVGRPRPAAELHGQRRPGPDRPLLRRRHPLLAQRTRRSLRPGPRAAHWASSPPSAACSMTSGPAGRRVGRGDLAQRLVPLLVLLAGLTLFEAVRETLVTTNNEALVPTLLLLGALVIPSAFVAFVAGRPMKSTVSSATLTVVAVAGGVVGVVIAGFLEFETLQRLGTAGKLGVAVIEETTKLIIPAGLLLLGRSRAVADGLLLGVASGAGFAALETMGYAFTTIVNRHGDLSTVTNLLLVRGLWSPAGHMAWTGITATALYHAVAQRFSPRSLLHTGRRVRRGRRPAHRVGLVANTPGPTLPSPSPGSAFSPPSYTGKPKSTSKIRSLPFNAGALSPDAP